MCDPCRGCQANAAAGLNAGDPGGKVGGMDDQTLPDLDELAAMAGLVLRPEWHGAVRANMLIILRLAHEVAAFPLDDDADLAPVFRP